MIDLNHIVAQADQVPGWMTTAELRWLAGLATTCPTIVEVGSWQGRSTKALSLGQQAGGLSEFRLLAVDTWEGNLEHEVGTATRILTPDSLYREFYRHLHQEILAGYVKPFRHRSLEAPAHLLACGVAPGPAGSDLIFLDGGHTYEQVVQDIDTYAPLVKPGGILAGHDLTAGAVRDAVFDSLSNTAIENPVASIWSVRL